MKKRILITILLLALATACTTSPTTNAINTQDQLTIQVDIPCSGHAQLIKNELYTIEGVNNVQYTTGHKFTISYNPALASEKEILSLTIFNTYPATKI